MKKLLLLIPFISVGCRLFGPQAKDPAGFERLAFDTTNVPMVVVHSFTNTITVTNVVPQFEAVAVPIYTTNIDHQVLTTFLTNEVTTLKTNMVTETNVVPAGSTVLVPQLAGPSAGAQAVVGIGEVAASPYGFGGLVAIILSGGLHWWQLSRNNALAAKYTGATATANSLQVAAGTLTQGVETMLEVMQGTPQGAALVPQIKAFLAKHQAEAGAFTQIAQLVEDNVDNPAAKEAAGAILKAAKVVT